MSLSFPLLRRLAAFALLLLGLAPAWARPAYDEAISGRRAALLERVARDYDVKPPGRVSFFHAEALFALGRDEAGRDVARRALETMAPDNTRNRWRFGGNSGFTVWPGIDCYLRYGDRFDDALKARFREIYTGGVFYPRLTTSNHKIMAAVTRYLATQVWGAGAFRPDPYFKMEQGKGNIFSKDDPTGESYVRQIIASTLKDGPGEYASLPYGAENILPLLTLADCATDAGIRRDALAAYEHCLGQLAPVWLGGHIATFAPRSYPDALNQQPWGLAAVLWVYFGGQTPAAGSDSWALRVAASAHRPPNWILSAGTERTTPYVHRAFISNWALYHYVAPKYVLFSRSAKAGGKTFSGQSHPCGLMWLDPDPSRISQFWITCPSQDTPEGTGKLHTHGVTSYEEELQRENALLYVFDIPSGSRHPYGLGYLPGGWLALDDSAKRDGRILVHYGPVLLSIHASKPFIWDPKAGIRAPATPPRNGDAEFRVEGPRLAIAVEVADPDSFPGATPEERLAGFRRILEQKTRLETGVAQSKFFARYRDRSGHVLECRFGGEDLIDGTPVNYANWPRSENPWRKDTSSKTQ